MLDQEPLSSFLPALCRNLRSKTARKGNNFLEADLRIIHKIGKRPVELQIYLYICTLNGKMLEWLKRHVWKACDRPKRFQGSNPCLSAKEG